jgi:hypothetical protein
MGKERRTGLGEGAGYECQGEVIAFTSNAGHIRSFATASIVTIDAGEDQAEFGPRRPCSQPQSTAELSQDLLFRTLARVGTPSRHMRFRPHTPPPQRRHVLFESEWQ